MKRSFKLFVFSIGCLISTSPTTAENATAPGQGLNIADAFKSLSEEELVKAMEESQRALADLLEHGTPEQKAEFEKALTDLAENLSPEDWAELQQIGQVYEKHHPYVAPENAFPEAQKQTLPPVEKKPEPVKEVQQQATPLEPSIKETLNMLVKDIDHMFHIITSHRDLSHKMKEWEDKTSFRELKALLIRLKKHAARLARNNDPENKKIIETLTSFRKDVETENKRLAIIEDEFGLANPMKPEEANRILTRATLVLGSGIDTLLPLLEKFFAKYEPEALEHAKSLDTLKSKAKEHEKNATQRRPSSPYVSTQVPYSPPSYTTGGRGTEGGNVYNELPQRKYRPSTMQDGMFNQQEGQGSVKRGQMDARGGSSGKGEAPKKPEEKKPASSDDRKQETLPFSKTIITAMQQHIKAFKDSKFSDILTQLSRSYSQFNAKSTDDVNILSLKAYANTSSSQLEKFSAEIEDMNGMLNALQTNVSKIERADGLKIINDSVFKEIKAKVQMYNDVLQAFINAANARYTTNLPILNPISRAQYETIHQGILTLQGITPKIKSWKTTLELVERKLLLQ